MLRFLRWLAAAVGRPRDDEPLSSRVALDTIEHYHGAIPARTVNNGSFPGR